MAQVHLINPMQNPAGGSEARTVALLEILSEVGDVQIWSPETAHPSYLGKVPIAQIGPPDKFPRGGTLVFVGTYFAIGRWLEFSEPKRVVIIQNLNQPDRLRQVIASISGVISVKPEIVYASQAIANLNPDLPGIVQESPIDLERFRPGTTSKENFTVGRLSRDELDKHHPNDPVLYARLASEGIGVRLMGATCLGPLGEGIATLPSCAVAAEAFLADIDCFYYRTHPAWLETYGRVIFEALAAGVPVVAESRHGYAEKLVSGENCLLFEGEEDGFEAILRLRGDVRLRQRLSEGGRKTVERIYGPEFRTRIQEFYSTRLARYN